MARERLQQEGTLEGKLKALARAATENGRAFFTLPEGGCCSRRCSAPGTTEELRAECLEDMLKPRPARGQYYLACITGLHASGLGAGTQGIHFGTLLRSLKERTFPFLLLPNR